MICVGNKEDICISVFEDAAIQNRLFRTSAREQQLPFSAGLKKCFDAESGTPIQIALRVTPIAKCSRNGNDALMLIIRQGDEDVDDPGRGLNCSGNRE